MKTRVRFAVSDAALDHEGAQVKSLYEHTPSIRLSRGRGKNSISEIEI